MKRLLLAALAATAALSSVPAAAQFAKPEDAIKYRQSALFVMATHFGRIGAMAAGRVPNVSNARSLFMTHLGFWATSTKLFGERAIAWTSTDRS